MRDLRIVFMGTPGFAVGVLKKLIEEQKNIVGVITAPDKPAGRGRKMRPSAVKEFALEHNLKVLQPRNLKNEDFISELASLKANLQIIVAFRMLPKIVWEMPEYGTFNLHASLLPQYRGAAPINWAIINQEPITGVTTFFIDEKIDTGEIILKSEVSINKGETVGTLHDTLMNVGGDLVIDTVNLIANNEVTTQPQPMNVEFKEAPKLTSDNTRIDWFEKDGTSIDAFIRGLSPYPVAWTMLQNNEDLLKVKVYLAVFEKEGHRRKVGDLIATKKTIRIVVEDGYILITELQLPGKRRMKSEALLNGFTFTKDAKVL